MGPQPEPLHGGGLTGAEIGGAAGGGAARRIAVQPPRRSPLPAVLALLLAGCAPGSPVDSDADLVVYGARIWDGTGAGLTEPSVLQISDGRVLSVAPMPEEDEVGAVAETAGVEAVDATGWYVIPGLINAHGHVAATWSPGGPDDYASFAEGELARYARFGVTTVNSLGGELEPAFALRDASWSGRTPPRARFLLAGPVLNPDNPQQAMVAIDNIAPTGPDWIKIRVDDNLGTTTRMSPETYRAVISRAHAHGLRVATHLFYHEDAKGLLRAGTDLVAHSVRDEPLDDETIALFGETGACYVPTLTREVSTYAYGGRPDFFDDPFLTADVDSAQVIVVSDTVRQARIAASGAAEAYGRALRVAQANLAVLQASGVPIAFGTDSGPMGRFQGYFEHMEIQLMAEAGLPADAILRSATGVAAECLDLDDVGTLEPGKRADFVVLRDNPMFNLDNMREIEGVWVDGRRVEGSRK